MYCKYMYIFFYQINKWIKLYLINLIMVTTDYYNDIIITES